MIDVITGPMFSGKTEELIRRIHTAETAGLKVKVFKPQIESRNESEVNAIATHNKKDSVAAMPVSSSIYIVRESVGYDVVAIDEAQFFDEKLYTVLRVLSDNGKWIIASGLDMDYQREPFSTMANLMVIADKIDKYTSICNICKKPAAYSKRVVKENDRVFIGGDDSYIPCCTEHFLEKK